MMVTAPSRVENFECLTANGSASLCHGSERGFTAPVVHASASAATSGQYFDLLDLTHDTDTAVEMTIPEMPLFTSYADCREKLAARPAEFCPVPVDAALRVVRPSLWAFKTRGQVWTTPAVTADTVYTGSFDGRLYAIDRASGTEKWQYRFPIQGGADKGMSVSGGMLYMTHSSSMYAFDSAKGDLLWSVSIGSAGYQTPVVIGGRVYVGGGNAVWAFDSVDGSEKWKFESDESTPDRMSSPYVADGVLYTGMKSKFYALDAADGTERWRFEADGFIRSTPVVVGDVVYFGSDDGVYSLSISDGEIEWKFKLHYAVYSTPAVADGIAYFASHDYYLYAVFSGNGTQLWRYYLGGRSYSSPSVVDGIVYVGSYDNALYSLDAKRGAELWRFPTKGSIRGSPTIFDDTVYFGSEDNFVYAVPSTRSLPPSLRFRYQTGGGVLRATPVIAHGKIYIGSDDKKLHAVESATGQALWTYRSNSYVQAAPVIVAGTIYVGIGSSLVALDSGTGSKVWDFNTGGSILGLAAVADGIVFVGSYSESIYAVNTTNGNMIWQFQTEGKIYCGVAVSDGVVYFGSFDYFVYALDARNGSEVWRFETGGRIEHKGSFPVVDGTVYVGSFDDKAYALDARTGALKWEFQTGGNLQCSLHVVGDAVIAGSADRNVYAIATADGRELWRFDAGDLIIGISVGSSLYVSTYNTGNVYAINALSGSKLWQYSFDGTIRTALAVDAEEVLYVAAPDSAIHAIQVRFKHAERWCASNQFQTPMTGTISHVSGPKQVLIHSQVQNVALASHEEILEACVTSWDEQFCNSTTIAHASMAAHICSPLAVTGNRPSPNPPYSCSKLVRKEFLEALSLAYGFAEPIYLFLIFISCRYLWTAADTLERGKTSLDADSNAHSEAQKRYMIRADGLEKELRKLQAEMRELRSSIAGPPSKIDDGEENYGFGPIMRSADI